MAEPKSYVAKVPLFVGSARAHNPGDPVPAENIKVNGWEDGVARVGTKAAEKAADAAAPEDVAIPPAATIPPPVPK